jgi:hypothetical protein
LTDSVQKSAAVAATLLTLLGSYAYAEERFATRYDVEVAGLTIMKINNEAVLDGGNYQSTMRAKSSGVLNFFSDLSLQMTSTGTIRKNNFSSRTFDYLRKRGSDANARNLKWNANGVANVGVSFDGDGLKHVEKTLAKGTRDPLSILLQVSFANADEVCIGTERAYDGRDVYDIAFQQTKTDENAIECRFTLTSVAGRDYDDALPKKAAVTSYSAIYKPVRPDNISDPIYVPFRIKGVLEGQNFTAKLKWMTLNGQTVVD